VLELNLFWHVTGITSHGFAHLVEGRLTRSRWRAERWNKSISTDCQGVTDAGLAHLDSLPGVTLEGTRVFPAQVRAKYTT
jgi:hypothetical protein